MQLLKKTIRTYFVFSTILLMAAIPVFYLALKRMMISTVDQDLMTTKTLIMPQLRNAVGTNSEGNLTFSGHEITFEKERPGHKGDSIYDIELNGALPGQLLPNRQLASHFYINQESYSLRIQTSMVDRILLIKRIILVSAIFLVALLLGLVVINRMLTKKIWQPFYHTLRRLQEYRVDKSPSLPLEHADIDEFNDLNAAIEQLAERNHQVYLSQKEFAENASHEMQSPLAVIQSKLELLMQTKPLTEDQAALIADLANASKRMSRLNKSLILLTKIDSNQYLEKETLSLKELIEKLLQQYEFQIRQQSIQLRFGCPEGIGDTQGITNPQGITSIQGLTGLQNLSSIPDIVIEANRTLLEILLGNLLSNAIRHNVRNGLLQLTLKENELIIQNSGRPSPLDTQRLFQRFQKDSQDPNSLGLGLEIVNKIALLNHFTLSYRFTDQLHTFSVRFS